MDIKITDKNIKLKDEFRKYIEVSIKNYDKIKASIDGLINIEWLELNILLAFDGDRTLLDVVDYIKMILKSLKIELTEQELKSKVEYAYLYLLASNLYMEV